jgi:hemolysin III
MILLFFGWFGGTIFHATRSSNIWFFMDIIPIGILAVSATIFFWIKLSAGWVFPLLTTLFSIIAIIIIEHYYKTKGISTGKSIVSIHSYFFVIIPVILPILILLKLSDFKNWFLVFGAFVAFIVSLYFKKIDLKSKPKYGTHWLWHVFGEIAGFMILLYIYLAI